MIRKIENIYDNIEGFNCFACGPQHPFGLQLTFLFDDELDEVTTSFQPDTLFAGFPNILHGGIQATILDELAFWGTYAKHQRSGFTYDMRVRYLKKCPVNRQLKGRAIVGELKHRLVRSEAQIIDPSSSDIIAKGTIKYFIPSSEQFLDLTKN